MQPVRLPAGRRGGKDLLGGLAWCPQPQGREAGAVAVRRAADIGWRVGEADNWSWDLTRHPPLRPFVSPDARNLFGKLDGLLGSQTEQPYVPVSPDSLPRALNHLNVAWRGPDSAAAVLSAGPDCCGWLGGVGRQRGDELTSRLGALADVFDLFTRAADGRAPRSGSLNIFEGQLVDPFEDAVVQDGARA